MPIPDPPKGVVVQDYEKFLIFSTDSIVKLPLKLLLCIEFTSDVPNLRLGAIGFVRPKSVIFACASLVSFNRMMFAGFRSRWTIW